MRRAAPEKIYQLIIQSYKSRYFTVLAAQE